MIVWACELAKLTDAALVKDNKLRFDCTLAKIGLHPKLKDISTEIKTTIAKTLVGIFNFITMIHAQMIWDNLGVLTGEIPAIAGLYATNRNEYLKHSRTAYKHTYSNEIVGPKKKLTVMKVDYVSTIVAYRAVIDERKLKMPPTALQINKSFGLIDFGTDSEGEESADDAASKIIESPDSAGEDDDDAEGEDDAEDAE
jgi:hypothetical protein